MEEKISIIVPVYNVEKYIGETIAAVKAQTYPNWEMLLIDDGSTDASRDIIEKLLKEEPDERIRIITQENQGAARARNRGMREARTRFVCYLDADDLWKPQKLEKQIAFMKETQVAFCFTGYEFADTRGRGTGRIVKVPKTINYRQALQNTTIFTSTVMFDTKQISKDRLQMPIIESEDTALWFKLLREGAVAWGLNENLVRYRRVSGSLSANKIKSIKRIWKLYRKAEKLSLPYSMYNFCFWAIRAVKRRL